MDTAQANTDLKEAPTENLRSEITEAVTALTTVDETNSEHDDDILERPQNAAAQSSVLEPIEKINYDQAYLNLNKQNFTTFHVFMSGPMIFISVLIIIGVVLCSRIDFTKYVHYDRGIGTSTPLQ